MTTGEFTNSNFDRNEGDRYFTEHACTRALLPFLPKGSRVWEPCAGRGDIARVLVGAGNQVAATDIDITEFDQGICYGAKFDFLKQNSSENFLRNIDAIITNPPFGTLAEEVVRKSLSYRDVRYHAFLLRTVWSSASTRRDLFTRGHTYAYEVKLTWRPRWDWWLTEEERIAQRIKANEKRVKAGKKPKPLDEPDASPMHNYSWFVWDRAWQGPCTTYWAHKDSQRVGSK